MHWVLQNNIFDEKQYDTLIETLERFEIPHSVHKVVPFVGDIEPDISPEGDVICIGSYSMRHIAHRKGWMPGVFDLEYFDFTEQLKAWGGNMLNHDAVIARFQDVVFTDDADSKVFPGKVMSADDFYEWQEKVCVLEEDFGDSLTKDTLVQVCRVRPIYNEVRYWVVDGKIVTSSVYKVGDRVQYFANIDRWFDDYVTRMIAIEQPAWAFVIDVCETPDGMKIVEVNTINSCGFYAADIPKLVHALEQYRSERYEEPS